MKSTDEFKEIDIKNRAWYYFDDTIGNFNNNFDNISLDQRFYENISVYDISQKTSTGSKPWRIKFNKIGGFINQGSWW